jgi:hypothetical protein
MRTLPWLIVSLAPALAYGWGDDTSGNNANDAGGGDGAPPTRPCSRAKVLNALIPYDARAERDRVRVPNRFGRSAFQTFDDPPNKERVSPLLQRRWAREDPIATLHRGRPIAPPPEAIERGSLIFGKPISVVAHAAFAVSVAGRDRKIAASIAHRHLVRLAAFKVRT